MKNEKLIKAICSLNDLLEKPQLTSEGLAVLGKMELYQILDSLIKEVKQVD